MRKSGALTFLACFIPGGGQMYQGYMKRGLSLIGWFFGIMFAAILTNIGGLSLFMLVVWAFAFFDAFNIHSLLPEQRAVFPDDFIPPSAWFSNNITSGVVKGKSGKIFGWALIIFGCIVLYTNFVVPFIWYFAPSIPLLYDIMYNLPSLLIAIMVIAAGIWLLKRAMQPAPQPPTPTDDTIPFASSPKQQPPTPPQNP